MNNNRTLFDRLVASLRKPIADKEELREIGEAWLNLGIEYASTLFNRPVSRYDDEAIYLMQQVRYALGYMRNSGALDLPDGRDVSEVDLAWHGVGSWSF
jgi:hypothetical protein